MKKELTISIISLIIVLAIVVVYILSHMPSPESTSAYPPELQTLIKGKPASLKVFVKGFENNSMIPAKYTCDDLNYAPEIIIENIPGNAVSLAVIVFDPDAPRGVFYHWILYDIVVNGSKTTIPENGVGVGRTTLNDFGRKGYGGPCPPPGDKPHHYIFLVLALDKTIGRNYDNYYELFNELRDHVIAYGVYIGLYKR